MFDPGLKNGDEINNQELCNIFKCGPQGGMRKSNTTQTLTIVSNHIKSVYDDRWIDEVFHYTGMGMKGDQSLEFMQNKTLAQSDINGINVHLFEVFVSKIYTYMGSVILSNKPYTEIQPDENGNNRNVWMFPLKLTINETLAVPLKKIIDLSEKKIRKAKRLSDKELKKRAENSSKKIGSRKVVSTQFERSVWVAENAKRKAKGICQLCNQPAPFVNLNKEPYLETHHIEWLSKGGEDSIENTVALCPNCHRKVHVLDLASDRKKLKQKA